jgi:hypothetical protein
MTEQNKKDEIELEPWAFWFLVGMWIFIFLLLGMIIEHKWSML